MDLFEIAVVAGLVTLLALAYDAWGLPGAIAAAVVISVAVTYATPGRGR